MIPKNYMLSVYGLNSGYTLKYSPLLFAVPSGKDLYLTVYPLPRGITDTHYVDRCNPRGPRPAMELPVQPAGGWAHVCGAGGGSGGGGEMCQSQVIHSCVESFNISLEL